MKKFLSFLLASVMVLALLTACGGGDNSSDSEPGVANTDTSQTEFNVISGISALSSGYDDNPVLNAMILKERVRRITHRPRTLALTGAVLAVLMVGIFCVACTGVRQEEEDSDRAMENTQESGDAAPEENMVSEGPQESSGEQPQHSGGGETPQDATDPTADHVRSDNAYYRVIRDTTIEDPYFTMEVPESLVGKVAYGVVLGQNEDGESYLRHLALFHVDSVSQLLEGEPQCGWNELAESGCLCYCFWMGYPDMGPELEDIAYRSGTWDIRGMEYLLSQGYDWIGGEGDRKSL